jgi:hypothetical protein
VRDRYSAISCLAQAHALAAIEEIRARQGDRYVLTRWAALIRYVEDDRIEIDTDAFARG